MEPRRPALPGGGRAGPQGVLRGAGVEVPKVHDVSAALRRNLARLPGPLADAIDSLVSASRRLREERELAFYGDEETGTDAESLFSRQDADEALSQARHVLDLCSRSLPQETGGDRES